MAFEFFKPRRETITFYNTKGTGRWSTTASTVSLADRFGARRVVGKLIPEIRGIAKEMPKVKYRTLESHEVKKGIESQELVIKKLCPAMDYVADSYDIIALVMSTLYDKILRNTLGVKFIPSGQGEFNINIPLRNGRKASVTLEDAPRTLMANVGPFDKSAAKREFSRGMRAAERANNLSIWLGKFNNRSLKNERYDAIVSQLTQKAKDKDFWRKHGGILKEAYVKQKGLIVAFSTAVYYATEELDDILFIWEDIDKILRYLIMVDRQSVYSDKGPLLPPDSIIKFSESIIRYLKPLQEWAKIARQDQITFQKTLKTTIDKVDRDPNVKLWEYKGFLHKVLVSAEQWARTATVDLERLLENFTRDLGQLQELRARASAPRASTGRAIARSPIFKI